jgi:hypothetical protein
VNKLIALILFVTYGCQPALAQEKLKSVVAKPGEPVPAGWICYDPTSLETIDASQRRGLDCEIKLRQSQQQITALRTQIEQDVRITYEQAGEWYDATWFKLSVGVAAGLTMGIIIGVSFR